MKYEVQPVRVGCFRIVENGLPFYDDGEPVWFLTWAEAQKEADRLNSEDTNENQRT